jgi:hypothetical protein
VGLLVLASGAVSRLSPGRGSRHERALLEALAATPSSLDPERSGLDERGVALKVLEHLRALVPVESQGLHAGDLDAIGALAARASSQAPFPDAKIRGSSEREAVLRSYLAAFGIAGPPRLEPRPASADVLLGESVLELTRGRGRGSLVYIVSPLPDEERFKALTPMLRQARRRRARLRWLHPTELPGLDLPPDVLGRVARTAARLRAETERKYAELRLRRLGVRAAACSLPDALLQSSLERGRPALLAR